MGTEKQRKEKLEYFLAQAEQYNFTREYNKAMEFYIRAGLLGDKDAIQEVCDKLKSGYGMSYNYNELFRCMMLGAKLGIADAMYELAVCYGSGIGTEMDTTKALYWIKEGAKAGAEMAKESLEAKEAEPERMSVEPIEEDSDIRIFDPGDKPKWKPV